ASRFISGVTVDKLTNTAFIIPYIFIDNPILVGVDVMLINMILAITTALIGMMALRSSMVGLFIRNSKMWERIALFIGGIFMITTAWMSNVIGIIIIVAM